MRGKFKMQGWTKQFTSLIIIALSMFLGSCDREKQAIDPFPAAREVRLFVVGYSGKNGGEFTVEPQGRLLTQNQRVEFESALSLVPHPDEIAACFIPHHFFRYFDSKGKKIGEIQICFCCAGVAIEGNPKLANDPKFELAADYDKVKELVKSAGLPTDIDCY